MNTSSRRAFRQQCGSGRADENEQLTPEQRWEWCWDSVANIHFDNGGRTLAKGMSPDLLENRPLRLRFIMNNTSLFSFNVR